MKRYLMKFAFRVAVFLGVLGLYLFHKDKLTEFATQPVYMGITPLHVLWIVFMESNAFMAFGQCRFWPFVSVADHGLCRFNYAVGVLFSDGLYLHTVLLSVPVVDNEK